MHANTYKQTDKHAYKHADIKENKKKENIIMMKKCKKKNNKNQE